MSLHRGRRLPLEDLAPYLLDLPEAPAPLDWAEVFGNEHPVEIEVGFGKGLFLLTSAQARPEVNFLGIEIARSFFLWCSVINIVILLVWAGLATLGRDWMYRLLSRLFRISVLTT